ncbi:hypothetical protein C2G38_2297617 [Gigaspora rosea]|uniref:CCHC-type domain-containing protein n=1 Tax=Gigaspora rosea TaxID=44941 RepID=A0A397TUN8_9GLOM|nr:hypothetical protein C2G38_2297617 [Gigaspora rosea]
MDNNDLLVSLVEIMVKIVVEVVRNLKIRQAKQHRYRPQLCYVCQCQEHLARSCSDQVKRECQEQMKNIRFMKIIDPKVGNYESERRIGKVKREIISNGTVKDKVTQMKNGAIPVKSISKGVESNKQKDNRAGVKRNEYETIDGSNRMNVKNSSASSDETRQKSNEKIRNPSELNNDISMKVQSNNGLSGNENLKKDEFEAFVYYQESADISNANEASIVGRCHRKGIDDEKDKHKVSICHQKCVDERRANGTYSVNYCYYEVKAEENRHTGISDLRDRTIMNRIMQWCKMWNLTMVF